jgi:hypothetical protein
MASQQSLSSPKPGAAMPPASNPSPPEPTAPPTAISRKQKLIIAGAAALALFFVIGLVIVAAGFGWSNRLSDKEKASALDNLKTAQRTWWESEGFAAGAKDPEGAFGRLQDKQRGWWDNEGLANKGDKTGAAALTRLEEMERDWLEREGLEQGQPAKDAAAALSRLEEITRKWFNGESVAKASTAESEEDAPPAAGGNDRDLADLQVKLLEKAGTRRFLDHGGTQASEEAVQLGLQWLASKQDAEGYWTPNAERGGKAGRGGHTIAATAFALLPFLARGETHKGSESINTYTKQVERGILWLIKQQKGNGEIQEAGGRMYTHALATIALCECLSMTNDPLLKGPCQKAIDFLIKAQAKDGGWRYTFAPAQADLSVSSWCLMALKSGQMAGITVPRDTLDKATQFLQHVSRPDGGYGYVRGSAGHSPPQPAVMTAAGIVCRQYLQSSSGHAGGTEDIRSAAMTKGTDIILKNPPRPNIKNYYYWYYATYALLPVGGDAWKQWNPQVRDLLVSMQDKGDKNPALKGSWDPSNAYQLSASGRVGCTALALLTLEVYYRHLPLNRPELGEMAKDLSKTTK